MEMTPGLNLESCPNQLSKFGELSIWRAFQMSSPNLVTIRLLTNCWLTHDWLMTDSWLTHDWLLTDSGLTLDWLPTSFGQTPIEQQRFVWDDTRSQFGEPSKSALQIWRAFQISSPNLVTIMLMTDCWLTPDLLLTDSQQTSDRLTLNQTVKFVGNDAMSQFGELSKSALQIWRAFQISSPNFVTVELLTDSCQTPATLLSDSCQTAVRLLRLLTDSWWTPDILLTDSQLTLDRLTLN